jgi:Desulfoferrodoxin, N-terminal domain
MSEGEMTQSNQDQPASQDPTASEGQAAVAPGSRFRCGQCGSEAIILQSGPARLTCCGAPLAMTFNGASR